MVAVVRDVQQQECLGEAIQKVEGDKLPGIRIERVESNPAARQHSQTQRRF